MPSKLLGSTSDSNHGKPVERQSENFAGVIVEDAPRSRRFTIIVGGIIILAVLVLITIVADFMTTGEVMQK